MGINRDKKMASRDFAAKWQGRGYEKGDTQQFWIELASRVFGMDDTTAELQFEVPVRGSTTQFVDVLIPSTRVLVEQKSLDKDLSKPIRQSDGSELTPFEQAKKYIAGLPLSQHPRWIVVSNFAEFHIHDMETPRREPQVVKLSDLEREWYLLLPLFQSDRQRLEREQQVSFQAGELVGKLYSMLLEQYLDPESPHSLRSLNVLCVRLVFCLYAEDADIFERDLFHDYLDNFKNPTSVRQALIELFVALDTPEEKRDPYIDPTLSRFPYVAGGLFAERDIEVPRFTPEIITVLLEKASLGFDWSMISPTIFGAVFESTINPETRRKGGMHYTSIENIHKVIDPLFLDDLTAQLDAILAIKAEKTRRQRLHEYQQHLASLTFLDPACGSGNFLTETYLSLRRLENRAITAMAHRHQMTLDIDNPIRVKIEQMHGLELNDFAVTVAKTALWISEAQMMRETERIVNRQIDLLPLKDYANIRCGNALTLDWNEVKAADELNYIMGNPPFVGARLMSKEQKADIETVFGKKWHGVGNMDYVTCWFMQAARMMRQNTKIATALVATNSIAQGEQVALLWKRLSTDYGAEITFAHRTFRWDSEATSKAHVHCVIVGFEIGHNASKRLIFDDGVLAVAQHINAYLMNDSDVWVESRKTPISADVPQMGIGNKPIDGGNYLFTRDEMLDFVKREPKSETYFRQWLGAEEFIHRRPRYCLWLGACSPAELRKMPLAMERIKAVRELRLASKSAGTQKLAERPTRFHVENMPEGNSIIVPRVSSEKREYVPMGFITPDILASDSVHLIPNATLYHFGVLTSSLHNEWLRAVGGRLEMRFRYSKDVVYNNFPWPSCEVEQQERIAECARAILSAREECAAASLADLYDPLVMPQRLRSAHRECDKAVLRAYGIPTGATRQQMLARLFELYREKCGM